LIKGRLQWLLRRPHLTVEDATDLKPIIGVEQPYLNDLNRIGGIASWFHGSLYSLNRAMNLL